MLVGGGRQGQFDSRDRNDEGRLGIENTRK